MVSYEEAVHSYIGLTLLTTALVGAFFVDRPAAPHWRQHAWLGLGLFLAWIVMGSNESWTPPPPEQSNVWWTPIEHLATMNGRITWWQSLQEPHVLQHKVSALLIAAPALSEWFTRWKPAHPATRYFRFVLPVALGGVGVLFLLHRTVHDHGHSAMMQDPAALRSELYQHWVFATALFAGAVTALLARVYPGRLMVPGRAWYAFVALGGLVFLTFRV
jgi:hypothetical protein